MKKFKKLVIACLGILVIGFGIFFVISHQSAITPVDNIDTSAFSTELIQKGKMLYDLGDCTVCHTAKGGIRDTGGLAIPTPMGTMYTTNITPDKEHGIGTWSFEAFKRAMRDGVNQKGEYLYPSFPYTAFTRTSDDDLKALYAYLMTRPAVSHTPPATDMHFPFSIRRGMYVWNLFFLDKGELKPVADKSESWNRGRYLVEGLGHCSACHTPRNFAAAEKSGSAHLSGGIAEGWYAPPLNGDNKAPNTWTKADFIDYMKTGFSARHSVAAGPMGPVIADGLSQIDDADRSAIADYLVSFQKDQSDKDTASHEEKAEENTEIATGNLGARIFTGSCMACHAQGKGADLYGTRPSLMLNTHFYVEDPNNVIRVVLNGIQTPATNKIGTMPAFKHNLNDEQISAVLNYIRQTYAQKPAWSNLEKKIEAIRNE